MKARSLEARLFDKVAAGPGGCWIFTGAHNSHGYGKIGAGGQRGRTVGAHRASWELFNGPIPGDLTVDHLCRVKDCVNPWHMDIVTRGENTRRASVIDPHTRETCANGHPWNTDSTYVDTRGVFQCRECRREANARSWRRKHPVSRLEKEAARTHCGNGHELTPENTYPRRDNGRPACKTCRRAHVAAYNARRAA